MGSITSRTLPNCEKRWGGEGRAFLIARVWHGYAKPEHADSYEAMLKPELLPASARRRDTAAVISCAGTRERRSSSRLSCCGNRLRRCRPSPGTITRDRSFRRNDCNICRGTMRKPCTMKSPRRTVYRASRLQPSTTNNSMTPVQPLRRVPRACAEPNLAAEQRTLVRLHAARACECGRRDRRR